MTIDHKTRFPYRVYYPGGQVVEFRRRPKALEKGVAKPAFSMGYRGFAKRFGRVQLK